MADRFISRVSPDAAAHSQFAFRFNLPFIFDEYNLNPHHPQSADLPAFILSLSEEQTKRRSIEMVSIIRISIALAIVAGALALAQDSEKPVKMADLPKAVQKTATEQAQGTTITGIAKVVEDGKIVYEVEIKIDGKEKVIVINPDGSLEAVEEVISLDSVPAQVKAEIERLAAGGKIIRIESVAKDGSITAYEALVSKGGKEIEYILDTKGKRIGTKKDD
jgi:uncharacterized membrane protein YkoI